MCSFSLTNSNIFSTCGHHIFKPFSVTSQHKQSRKCRSCLATDFSSR
ncbi:hypothetical protein E2C01_055198 [Portunus trituberculatus]|uniref:Uncharacterized protein n=1 Tax=Portunus trituberculatus TaxID=210409 RepID=A0A5B7GX02_PORTR|nr:hypothetical protein [Portunus trituberculatus]